MKTLLGRAGLDLAERARTRLMALCVVGIAEIWGVWWVLSLE